MLHPAQPPHHHEPHCARLRARHYSPTVTTLSHSPLATNNPANSRCLGPWPLLAEPRSAARRKAFPGRLAFNLRLRSGAGIHHLAQIATTDRPPALQRRRASTSSLERVAVVDCTTNDLPSCLRVQGSAQPTPNRVRHRQLACSSCRQHRSPRATGTDVERTYVFADQGGGA